MSANTTTAPETSTAEPPFDPAVMRGVIPYLGFGGRASDAADFYARAFGARELGRYEDAENPGRLLHVQIEINGGCLMMTDCHAPSEPEPPEPQGFHLQLVVAGGDAWWSRALAAGCTVVMPFERQFWGDRWGMVLDPFGIRWAFNEPAAGDSRPTSE